MEQRVSLMGKGLIVLGATLAQMDGPGRLLGTHLDGVTEVALLSEPEFVIDVEGFMFRSP